jgi:signal transduction histidine kinase
VKHAHADLIIVRVRVDGRLGVDVIDDGIGIPDSAAGHGLTGMSDRVAALDGSFAIAAAAGGGTVVSFCIPLPSEAPTGGNREDAARAGRAPARMT